MGLEPAGVRLVAEGSGGFDAAMKGAGKLAAGLGVAAEEAAQGVEALARAAARAQKIEELTGALTLQQRQLAILQQELAATSAKYGEGSVQAQKKQLAVDKLAASIGKVEAQIGREKAALDAETAAYNAAAQAAQKDAQASEQNAAQNEKAAQSAAKQAAAAEKTGHASERAAAGVAKVAAESNKAADGASRAAGGFTSLSASLGKIAGVAGGVLKVAGGLALRLGTGIAAGLGAAAVAGLGFNNSLEQASARIQAFTKDSAVTAQVLDMVRERAAKTPFEFNEMASAAASLGPAAKSSNVPLEELLGTAEILAASNPAEGLEGAAFAIKEAASGDFASAIERFNLSRQYINQLKDEGVPALEILSKAMLQAGYDADLVSQLANTAGGRLSTFTDTFTNLAGVATKPIFDAFSKGLGEVNSILEAHAPLLEEAAAGIAELLAPAGELIGEIMVAAANGLVSFAQHLPEIAAVGGQVAGVLMALAQTARQWWDALAPLIGQALQWGANFIGQVAKGMWQAVSVVVSVLQQIGSIIAGWLAPGSPPKLLPDLPSWGQSAVNEFMAGWANPDMSAFSELSGSIEGMLRDLVDTGAVDEGGVLNLIFGSRDAIARAVEEFRTLGSVSEESFGAIRDAAGPAGSAAERFARSYFELQEATNEVARAQAELNNVTSEYAAILNPLNAELQGIQDRKQEIKDAQRVAELQQKLAEGKLDEQEAELARLEIAEIGVEQQIRSTERERDAAVEGAEAKLTAAEEAQTAAQTQFDAQQQAIDLQSEQNRLIGEQIALLERLAKEQATAAKGAGGGAGLPSLGGGDLGLGKLDEVKDGLGEVNRIVQEFKDGIANVQASPLIQQIKDIGAAAQDIPGYFSNARDAVDGFFTTPLGTELREGAGVVADYFANDFQTDLTNGINIVSGKLKELSNTTWANEIKEGAGVVASYFVNDWPGDFQAGADLVGKILSGLAEDQAWVSDFQQGAGVIGDYFANDFPKHFSAGADLAIKGLQQIQQWIEGAAADYAKGANTIGAAIIQGIIQGLDSASGGLFSKVTDIIAKTLGTAQTKAEAHSPSELFAREIGEPISQGIAKGILARVDTVMAAAESLSDDVLKELESLAKNAQKLIDETLAGIAGFARARSSAVSGVMDAEREVTARRKEQSKIGSDIAKAEADRAKAAEDAAQQIADLEAERADLARTAEQHIDPAERADAARRLLEIERELADARQSAAADDEAAQARIAELWRANEQAGQSYTHAIDRARRAQELLAEATTEAQRIARNDPKLAQDYLDLRNQQINDLLALQAAYDDETAQGTKELLATQLELLTQAQAAELASFEQQAQRRADEIASLAGDGKETGDALIDGIRQAIAGSTGALSAALTQALETAIAQARAALGIHSPSTLTAGLVGVPLAQGVAAGFAGQVPAIRSMLARDTERMVSPVTSVAGASYSSVSYGGNSVTINGSSLSETQLERVINRVLDRRTGTAQTMARM